MPEQKEGIHMPHPETTITAQHGVTTVEDTVSYLLPQLSSNDLKRLSQAERSELRNLDVTPGMEIRKAFSLWDDSELLGDCGVNELVTTSK